jgi:hypothetical protein
VCVFNRCFDRFRQGFNFGGGVNAISGGDQEIWVPFDRIWTRGIGDALRTGMRAGLSKCSLEIYFPKNSLLVEFDFDGT